VKDQAAALISDLMTTMSTCTLYTKEHPAVMHLGNKAVTALESLYAEDKVSIALFGDSIVFNEQPLAGKSLHVTHFMKKLRRKGIDKVIIARGVTGAELREFLSEVALADKITGSYPHISAGIIEVMLTGGADDVSAAMNENIEKLREIYQGVSRFKQLDMVGLEDVVSNFIVTLRQEANILKVVSPIKAHSEYTYAHNTNVSVLAIFQAESLGIRKELHHDIGLAGLLHDIGKMFVPKEVLEKETKLDDEEWSLMKKHPVYGAMYLATLPDLPKYALVASYEHHMKFNGSGYPSLRRNGKRQHIISQIISIADFFDALRTDRPYRKSLGVPVIVGLLKDLSGKEFNPMLVENFIYSLKKVTSFAD
jgi:HD-GYP domain-containing protein (c-di-GMP phosphodiesterase class II)